MPGRTLLVIAILILGVTVPFLLGKRGAPGGATADAPPGQPTDTRITSLWQSLVGDGRDSTAVATSQVIEASQTLLAENRQLLTGQAVKAQELAGLPGVSLADALRFDVTPAWVSATWPRLTPQRMEAGMYGLRVPLVTGTMPEDVAGSLTYYFNAQNYVERLTLVGYTGDAEPLVSLVQQQYALRPYAAIGRGLFLSFYGPTPIGILKVEDAAVQSVDAQRTRYRVQLELNLPRPGAMLSEPVMDQLRRLHEAKLL